MPSFDNVKDVAYPIPLLAPVIIATFFSTLKEIADMIKEHTYCGYIIT
jgi:hypothetical protein